MGLKAVVVVPAVSSLPVTSSPTTVPAVSGITIVVVNNSVPTTVNLPASPAPNQIVIVQDGGLNADTQNITVQGNGNNIDIPQLGASSSYVIGANGTDVWLNWKGTSWGVLA